MKQHWIAAAAAVLVGAASIAQSQPLPVDIAPCVGIDSALARLDCYDGLARNASAPSASPAPTPSAGASPQTAAESRGGDASLPGTDATPTRTDDEIASTVVRLRELQPGRLEIELANGQVWRQTSSDRYRLQVGHEVRLSRTRFGGQYFRLTAPVIRGFVQVERIR